MSGFTAGKLLGLEATVFKSLDLESTGFTAGKSLDSKTFYSTSTMILRMRV
jgi:hypothetical protein